MKRENLIFISIIFFFTVSCSKNTGDIQLADINTNKDHVTQLTVFSTNDNIESITIVVRHSETPGVHCDCPGCKCPGCPCPLGICICGGIQKTPAGGLTDEQKQEGYGTAWAEVVDGKLHLIFNQPTALPDKTIPIESDWALDKNELNILGIPKDCYIEAGIYNVDFSKSNFGEVFLNLNWI